MTTCLYCKRTITETEWADAVKTTIGAYHGLCHYRFMREVKIRSTPPPPPKQKPFNWTDQSRLVWTSYGQPEGDTLYETLKVGCLKRIALALEILTQERQADNSALTKAMNRLAKAQERQAAAIEAVTFGHDERGSRRAVQLSETDIKQALAQAGKAIHRKV